MVFRDMKLPIAVKQNLEDNLREAIGNQAENNPDFGNYLANIRGLKNIRVISASLKDTLTNEAIVPKSCFTSA